MKKWVCSVCGYVYEGEQPPVECPVCHVDGSKFIEQKAEKSWLPSTLSASARRSARTFRPTCRRRSSTV